MSRQVRQNTQLNKKQEQPNKKKEEIVDDISLNIDNLDDDDVRSSEIHETLKKTQNKNQYMTHNKVQNKSKNVKNKKTVEDEGSDDDILPTKKGKVNTNHKQIIDEYEDEDEDDEDDIDKDKDSSDMSDIDDDQEISDAFGYDDKKAKAKAKKSLKHNNNDENDGADALEEGDENEEEMDEEFVQTVVMERVLKYIKLDDVIKEKQNEHKKEMKTLKDTKDQLEQFLISFLDKINEEYIQLGNKSTLIKTETQTKAAPKMEDISVCLIDGFRKYEIYEDDEEIKRVVKDFIKTIDEKREIKTRKYLKRMNGDPDKKNNEKNASEKGSTASRSNKSNKSTGDAVADRRLPVADKSTVNKTLDNKPAVKARAKKAV